MWAPTVLVACGTLRNDATKNVYAKNIFIPIGHFWEMHKENEAFL